MQQESKQVLDVARIEPPETPESADTVGTESVHEHGMRNSDQESAITTDASVKTIIEPRHKSELYIRQSELWNSGLSEARLRLLAISQRMPNLSPLDRLRLHLRNKAGSSHGLKRSAPFGVDDDGLDYDALRPTEWFTLQ